MNADNKVFLNFKSLPRNVALARLVVASVLAEDDILLSELDEIKVAVSEAVSNAIIH
ncbi:MAG: ATP-binding protein, partial [Clostridiales bacterium]|nr:ATP-binding protein [Clostridiales bacterium]